jgi:hypothetical protein
MKKLFSLLTLALLTMSAWAATTVTFDFTTGYENQAELTTVQKDGVTLTFNKGTNNNPTRWYENGASARMYGGNTLNIASNGDNITEVVFTFTGTANTMNSTATCSVDAGTYVEDGTTGTWTGNAQNFTITRGGTTGHARIASIEVIMGGEVVITVADPVFTPADGAMFTDSQEISLSCTTGGATINYSTDGLVWNEYTEPFTITETTTVYAKAVLGNVESNVVTATYTKSETPANEPIVFKSSEDQGNGSTTRAEWTIVKNGITINCSDGTVYTENYRIYSGATLTISSTVGNITMIEFVNTDNSRPISNLSTETGTLTINGAAGTWVGEAASVAFSASAQTRASEIHVYVDGGSTPIVTVAAPTLPASQNFEESLSVEIINNEEGATLMYALNDGEFTAYTQALNITETTTVHAKAVKGENESATVSATYTKVEPVTGYEELNDVNELDGNVEFAFIGNAVVTFQKNGYLWLRDNSGYGLIYGNTNGGENPTFEPGTVLAQPWSAKTSIYNGLMEYVNATGLADSGNDNTELAAIQTITALDANMINAYVQVLNVKSFAVNGKNVTATLVNGNTMAMYKTFNDVDVPTTEGNYTVIGAVSTYNDNLQLTIIDIQGAFVVDPVITPASCDFEESVEVTITAEEGAAIKYSTDEQATWNDYSEPLNITETTTVYAKAVKDNVESGIVSATYTKVDPATQVTYTLVTDVNELADGDKIILVGFCADTTSADYGKPYAMADYRGEYYSNFAAVEVTVVDNTVTTALANVITLEANGEYWNLKAAEGYLWAAGNSTTNKKNHMRVEDEVDADGNANATITIDGAPVIAFQGTNDRNYLRYNYNNGSCLFSCYAQSSSVQTPAYIFKAKAEPAGLRGDVNEDEVVSIDDVTALIDILLQGTEAPATADSDLSGGISIDDVTCLIDYLLTGNWPN